MRNRPVMGRCETPGAGAKVLCLQDRLYRMGLNPWEEKDTLPRVMTVIATCLGGPELWRG